MRLINAADGEGFYNAFMRPLTSGCVLIIERTFMLIDHNAVLFERLVAVSVKLAGE